MTSQPRQPVDPCVSVDPLPRDLDAYLARREGVFADLVAGTEKTIVWADPVHKPRTPIAVVYLHGFSASRQETRPLSDLLAARLGANLFYTRLSGHGRSGEALAAATAADWLSDASEAYAIGKRLGERVLLVGCSTGAMLATWLASRGEAHDILALVQLSPNFRPAHPGAHLLDWPGGVILARLLGGGSYGFTPANAKHALYWTTRYPVEAARAMMTLLRQVNGRDLRAVRAPLLMLYAPGDQVVDARAIERRFAQFGSPSKELVAVTDASDPRQHILAGDVLSPASTRPTVERILRFLARHAHVP